MHLNGETMMKLIPKIHFHQETPTNRFRNKFKMIKSILRKINNQTIYLQLIDKANEINIRMIGKQ